MPQPDPNWVRPTSRRKVFGGTLVSALVGPPLLYGEFGTSALAAPAPAKSETQQGSPGVVNVREFGARGDGVADDSGPIAAAIAHALDAGIYAVHAPFGTYRIGSPVIIQRSADAVSKLCLRGDGVDITSFIVDGSVNTKGFLRFEAAGRNLKASLSDFSVLAHGSGCGTAIALTENEGGNRHDRSVVIENIEIKPVDYNKDYFNVDLDLRGTWRPYVRNVICGGPYGPTVYERNAQYYSDNWIGFAKDIGIDVWGCYGPHIENTFIWSCKIGVRMGTSTDFGAEGLELRDTVIVSAKVGVHKSVAGYKPGFSFTGGHINYRDYGIHLEGCKNCFIRGVLFHNEDIFSRASVATPADIHLARSFDVIITDNIFHYDGHPNRSAILCNQLKGQFSIIVSNNSFRGKMRYAFDSESDVAGLVVGPNGFSNWEAPQSGKPIRNGGRLLSGSELYGPR